MIRTVRRLLHPIGVCDLTCLAILICAQTIRCSTRSTTCHLKSCKRIGAQTVHLWRGGGGGGGGRATSTHTVWVSLVPSHPRRPNTPRWERANERPVCNRTAPVG